jgi:Porin subfamily
MTSTKKVLLGTAAATMAVAAGGNPGAQAADILRKAPPIQYVRICDQYGAGFWQLPGSSICLQLRGQVQSDNDYQRTQDLLFVTPSKGSGSYTTTFQAANQQDHLGYEVTAKPRFDARTETSVGTMRAYAELKIQLDAGAFVGPPGPGGSDIGAGNKTELYRGYMQWAGWTLGLADSLWSLGGFKDGAIADVIQSDKSSGWTAFYVWTPSGPGVPPKRGSAPVPDGWSFSLGADSPFKHIAKAQIGGGCAYYDLALVGSTPVGTGTVCASNGTYSLPDFVGRIHWEGDPPGKDDQHNDQFGIGSFHLAAIYHQITMIGAGGTLIVPAQGSAACGGPQTNAMCAFGQPVHDHGWAVQTAWKFFVPMWPGTKLGSQRTSDADNIAGNVLYCDGALELCGIGATNGNLSAGDAYWAGGLARDDLDGRIINNGQGGFRLDHEKALAANIQYYTTLTDCTDPIHCLTLDLEANGTWVTPGSITQNVDWTQGGLGKAHKVALTGEISWGTTRYGTTRPTSWRVDNEIQWFKIWQDLPNNCNGGSICAAPTPLPATIAQDPWTLVWRETVTFDF